MEISHGMSFHLVWDLTIVRPTNRTSPPPHPPFFFFFLPKHYTLSVLRTLHYCNMVLRVLSHYRSVITCARARTHARAHKAYLYIDGT